MTWYYAQAGQQRGPVSDEELQALVNSGVVTSTTLVWREGMTDWRPYAAVVAPPPPPVPGAPPLPSMDAAISGPTAVCAECGRVVAAADTVALEGRAVCANCKPRVVQRMMEGAEVRPGVVTAEAFISGLRAQGGFRVEIGSAISRGFALVHQNFWPSVGITALIYLTQILAAQIPCIGMIAPLIVTGPLTGGLYYYFLLQVRGQSATINEAFSGFQQPVFTQLLLASLVVQALPMVVTMVVMAPLIVSMELAGQNPENFPPWLLGAILVFVPLMLYYTLITTPSFLIIADTRMQFWEGIKLGVRLVHMRFWSFLGFLILSSLLVMAGFLLLCVGIFWTMPAVVAAGAYIWSDIVRTSEAGRAATTGTPAF